MKNFIPYGNHWIDQADIKAVNCVLKSEYLTQGPRVEEFEKALCKYTKAKYCIVVSNGTAALHLAVAALAIERDSEGITSPNSFVASANCLAYNNLIPVFVDIDKDTYNIKPFEIEKSLTKKTKVIIPVHFAGQPCDMLAINAIAKKNKLFVIEDAAHAIGSKYLDGSHVGNCKYSDMTIFSFHPVKTMTTGEGGAITTNNKVLYEKLKMLRIHGITKDSKKLLQNPGMWYYEMQMLGFNYRMTDIQAALGLSQLKKLDKFIKRRREIVKKYNKAFRNINWIKIPYETEKVCSAFHLYVLQIDFDKINKSRQTVMKELKNNNIGTQVHYIPIYKQPYYQNNYKHKKIFPNSEEYYKKTLSIPLYPKMHNNEINKVITCVKNIGI